MALVLHFLVASFRQVEDRALSRPTDPCKEVRFQAKRLDSFSRSGAYTTAAALLGERLLLDSLHEYVISFGRDSAGEIILSAVGRGGRSNSAVPMVQQAFADLHNHPRGTPPSSGDVYGLLRQNRRNYLYNTRFVLARRTLYALVVTDTLAARLFAARYPPQQVAGYSPLFPDSLLQEYRDIQGLYGAKEEVAMAYLLEKYQSGVSLFRQGADGRFKMLRTVTVLAGERPVFVADNCL